MEEFAMEDYLLSARNFFDYLGVRARDQILLTPTYEYLQSDPLAIKTLQHVSKERDIQIRGRNDGLPISNKYWST